MIVTVTSLELKNIFLFFPFSLSALKVVRQLQKSDALTFKSTGLGKKHYTLSLWPDGEKMRAFARSGAHLEAMKKSSAFAREIRTYSFESEQLPDWKSAKALLSQHGKVLTF